MPGPRSTLLAGLACLIAIGFLTTAPARSQEVGGISVRVSDYDTEEPIFQADVQVIVFARGTFSQRAFTDGGGRVVFQSVARGNYNVEASHPDYETAREAVDVAAGLTSSVFLRLRRKPEKPRAAAITGSAPATSLSAPPKARKEFEDGKSALKSDVPKSMTHFRRAIELHPQYAEAHAWLAFALMKEKKDADAMNELDKAIEIDGKLSLARALRGRLLVEWRQFERAEEDLKEAVASNPLAWEAHYDLARIYVAQGKLDLALDHAQKAHDVQQAPASMHLLLHDIYSRRNDFASAIKELEDFVKAEPKDPRIPRIQQRIEELKKKS